MDTCRAAVESLPLLSNKIGRKNLAFYEHPQIQGTENYDSSTVLQTTVEKMPFPLHLKVRHYLAFLRAFLSISNLSKLRYSNALRGHWKTESYSATEKDL